MSETNGFIGRRALMKVACAGGIGVAATMTNFPWYVQPALADSTNAPQSTSLSPDAALQRLLDGNDRFVGQKRKYPNQSLARLRDVAFAQHPFVTLLTCADSRVPCEIIFDEGIGDIFDVRVAGNVVAPEVTGSIEYAALVLETPLIVVLGHERCGAVTAAVKNEVLPGQMGAFVQAIAPAVAKVKSQAGDRVENAVVANVQYQIERLKQTSEPLVQLMQAGKLNIVGGRYDLDTGKVTIVA